MTAGISEDGTVLIMGDITEDGMIRGSGEATGDGTTHGTALITILTIADGTADGTHTGDITTITDTDTSAGLSTTRTYGTVQDTVQVPTVYSEALHRSEEESEAEAPSAGAAAQSHQAAYRHPPESHPAGQRAAGQRQPFPHRKSAEVP